MANMTARTMDTMTAGFDHWIKKKELVARAEFVEDYLPEDFRCNARSRMRGWHQPELNFSGDRGYIYIKAHG